MPGVECGNPVKSYAGTRDKLPSCRAEPLQSSTTQLDWIINEMRRMMLAHGPLWGRAVCSIVCPFLWFQFHLAPQSREQKRRAQSANSWESLLQKSDAVVKLHAFTIGGLIHESWLLPASWPPRELLEDCNRRHRRQGVRQCTRSRMNSGNKSHPPAHQEARKKQMSVTLPVASTRVSKRLTELVGETNHAHSFRGLCTYTKLSLIPYCIYINRLLAHYRKLNTGLS